MAKEPEKEPKVKFNPDDYENIRDLTSEIQNNMQAMAKSQIEMAEHSDYIDELFTSIGDTSNIMGRQIAKVQEKIKNDLKETTTSSEGYAKIQSSIEDILTNHKNLSDKAKSNLFEQLDNAKAYYDVLAKTENAEKKRNELVDDLTSSADSLVDGLKSQVESIPIVGKLLSKTINFDGIKSNFQDKIVGGFTKGFDTARDAGKGMTGALTSGLKGAIASLRGFMAAAGAALLPLLLLAGAVMAIKAAFNFNKETTQLAKDLGVSVDEARGMEKSFNNMSVSSSNLNVNTKSLVEAQKQLSSATGLTAEFSEQMLTDQIQLTKFMGLTGDEAATFQKIAIGNNQTAREMQGEIAGSVEQFNNATGASVSLKDVVQDIAKLPTHIRVGFKGTTAELAKTVAMAKAMGTTLEKSVEAGKATLDIETSLKNEAQARILTGVSINNNAIRAAQLAGNQAEVLRLQKEEMQKIGDIGDYLPYQQDALAAAMGMSTAELVEQSGQMKLLEKVGGDLSKATLDEIKNNSDLTDEQKDQLIQQKEQISAQERLSQVGAKFKDMLNSIVSGPLGQIAELLVNIIVPAFKGLNFLLTPIINGLAGIQKIISSLFDPAQSFKETLKEMGPLTAGLAVAFSVIGAALLISILPALGTAIISAGAFAIEMGLAAVAAITTASATTLGIGIVAVVAGIAAGIAAMSTADDMVAPSGYGDRVLTGPEGSIALNNKDSVIAGTDLFGNTDGGQSSENTDGGQSGGTNQMGAIFQQLVSEVRGLRSDIQAQPIMITVDGRVVSEITRVQNKQSSFRK